MGKFLLEILGKVSHLIGLTDIKRVDALGRKHNGDGGEFVNNQLGRIPIPY